MSTFAALAIAASSLGGLTYGIEVRIEWFLRTIDPFRAVDVPIHTHSCMTEKSLKVGGGAPAMQMNGFREEAGYPNHTDAQCGQEAPSDPLWYVVDVVA